MARATPSRSTPAARSPGPGPALLLAWTAGCGGAAPLPVERVEVEALAPLAVVAGVPVAHGGFGSAAASDPEGPGRVYLLTDRGPNYDAGVDVKAFPAPAFGPVLGLFALPRRGNGDGLSLVRSVALRHADGSPFTGLPRPPGAGATGETPVAADGTALPLDPAGIDPEGLHVLRDGSFWVADEYGPALLHFDRNGRLLVARGPGGAGGLPAVLARRRPNRGFEGLTGDPDGRTLVAVVQSALDNPREAGRRSPLTRLLVLDTGSGRTRQFLYQLDDPAFMASDLAWIDERSLLVLEHDALFLGGTPAARAKRVYRVDLAGATDVSDSLDRPGGLVLAGRTLEELDPAGLAAAGIRPVAKALVVDLLAHGYPHDKPEGLVVIDPATIGVVNDDDFGIIDGPDRRPVVKRLPATGEPDRNVLWLVPLGRPLR